RYLIEACADRLLLVADGRAAPFDGDLDDYRRLVLSERGNGNDVRDRRDAAPARAGRAEIRRAAAEKRIELAPLRRRVTEAEKAVNRIAAEIARIDLALTELFARDPAKAATLSKERARHASALAAAEEDWLAASAELEASGRNYVPVGFLLAFCCLGGAGGGPGARSIDARRPPVKR